MNKKIAIIKPKLSLVTLNVIKTFEDISFYESFKFNYRQKSKKIIEYLQNAVKELYNAQLIVEKSIVIDYISGFDPTQITFSVQCEINILNLKELQTCLLENGFKLKIIL